MKPVMLMCLVLLAGVVGPNLVWAAPPSPMAAGSNGSETGLTDLALALTNKQFAAVDKVIKAINPAKDGKAAIAVARSKLKDPDPGVRRLAAYALSQIDREEAKQDIPLMIEALRDGEPRIRARIALTLGLIGPAARESIPALGEALKDQDPHVRAGAARALGSMGTEAKATIPRLAELLKDKEAPVRAMASLALGQFGSLAKDSTPALGIIQTMDPDANVREAAGSALEMIDPPLRVLIEALKAPDPNRRLWAVSVLTEKGSGARTAVPNLMEVLKQDDAAQVRATAAFALGKVRSEARNSSPVLIAALKDKTARVRTAAALALGNLGSDAQAAGPALALALQDEDAEVAASAATALGSLGPQAASAVPILIDLQKKDNLALRRRAVNVLARIGAAAGPAVPGLLEALRDADPGIRHEAAQALISAGPQPRAPIPALIEALHYTESETDLYVRAWACLSLGQIGPPAADAITALLQALQDDDGNVRVTASYALGQIGHPAVPALVKALNHVDARVRMGAVHALGGMGAGARRAIDNLREALGDEDAGVGLAAADALARIAVGLQLSQDTRSIPDLEETWKVLHGGKTARLTGEQQAEWKASGEQIREAIQGLRTIERAQFFDRIFHSHWFPWLAGAFVYGAVLFSAWMLLLWRRPLLLLRINDALRPLPIVRLPGGMELSLRAILLVGFFNYHRRVLDAWVAQHIKAFRDYYQSRRTVKDRSVYVPVPVIMDGQVVPGLTVQQLRQTFGRKRECLLIWGEGGSGKTALACQMGRWALAENPAHRLCEHIMLPILIEHELDLRAAEGKPAFVALMEAVRGQLQALIGDSTPLPRELLEHLLRQRRILVIVDHLSEVSAATRAAIRPGLADFTANALVVTSRSEEALDGVPKSVIQPLRIEGNRLSSFVEAYLVQRGKRQLFDDAEYSETCRRLSLLAGARDITVLLAKLQAEQMIARKESRPQGSLPSNLPDLILGYLNELNRAVEKGQRRSDFEVQRDAEALAWECLRHNLRLEPAELDAAFQALGGEDAEARLAYLEEQLKIISTVEPARDRVSFTLEPLAEYLAALHVMHKHRQDPDFWREFVARVALVQTDRAAIKGFLLALRECCITSQPVADVLVQLDEQIARSA